MNLRLRIAGAVSATALVATACGGAAAPTRTSTPTQALQRGGVLRIGLASDVHEALDPAREYYTIGWEFLRCCLARTLLGFNLEEPTRGGNKPIPDLAQAMPTVSPDGLTWTFKIKSGVHYAPPLQDVTVTAQDFIRALTREALSQTAASYPFYFSVIQGFDEVQSGKAKTISGLSAPDPQTLVVKLTKPVGYFPYLFTLPATAPIPPKPGDPSAPLGVAEGHLQDYGQFISSTGPYMFKGADRIDYSKPAKQQTPPEGFQAGKSYVLVRNPSWDPATDSVRKAYVDEIDVTVGGTVADIQNKIKAGELDTMDALPNPEGVRDFVSNPDLKPFIHSDPVFGTYYINMNLAMPPFDDIHVRKAMNYVVDKAGLLQLAGGPIQGTIAHHVIPETMLPGLAGYNPYPTPGDRGDVAKAQAEMRQSRYDSNHDGVCDASACKNALMVIDQTDPNPKMAALIQQDAQRIGITFNIKQFETTTMYTKCEDAKSHIPICPSEGWFADFADPYAFVTGLFHSSSLTPSCCDDSLTGATTQQLRSWGYGDEPAPPSADAQLDACVSVLGPQRARCYEGVDRYLMENVVPWIPYRFANEVVITSTRVRNYHMDASSGWISLSLVALAGGGK